MSVEKFKEKNGYEINGFWMPRVTSITEIVAKAGLLFYYAQQNNYAEAQRKLQRAADWGTLTHETVESLLRNEPVDINPMIEPSINAFREWQEEHKLKILNPEEDIERKVFDEKNLYAGTLDIVGEVDGKVGVIDLKTGSGIWNEYSLQTAAYMQAHNKNCRGKKAQTRWILRLDQYQKCLLCGAKRRVKDGTPRIIGAKHSCFHYWEKPKGYWQFKELKNQRKDFCAFLNAKKLWEWYNGGPLCQIKNYPKNSLAS